LPNAAKVRPNQKARTALEIAAPMCPNSAWSKRSMRSRGSAISVAFISFSTHGWHRIAPWPKIISERVMMFAPSTVMLIGVASQPRPR